MMAPAIIKPINFGILMLFNNIGLNKMMNRIKEKSRTGLLKGKEKSKALNAIIIEGLIKIFSTLKMPDFI